MLLSRKVKDIKSQFSEIVCLIDYETNWFVC